MQAIILAGGLGERLYPLTESKPKWLLPLGNGTIADYQLSWLKENGIDEVFVTVNKRHSAAVERFVERRDSVLVFIYEENPVGDEGGLKNALSLIDSDEVFVLNCDIITDLPLRAFLLTSSPSMVLVHPRSPWGVFTDDGRFEEKPRLNIWVSGGIYKFGRSIRDELVDDGSLARNIISKLIREDKMYFYTHSGLWVGIETSKDLNEAERLFEGKL